MYPRMLCQISLEKALREIQQISVSITETAVSMQTCESTLQEAGLKPLLCLPMVAPADILHPIPPALIIGTAPTIANGVAGFTSARNASRHRAQQGTCHTPAWPPIF